MASCSIYPSRPDRSRRNRATRVSYPAEFSRKRCLLPRLSNLDLLPDLDAARSSRLRCCPGRDRKIPSAMVAPSDESCPWLLLPGLALVVYALYLGEGDYLTVAAAIWQF